LLIKFFVPKIAEILFVATHTVTWSRVLDDGKEEQIRA